MAALLSPPSYKFTYSRNLPFGVPSPMQTEILAQREMIYHVGGDPTYYFLQVLYDRHERPSWKICSQKITLQKIHREEKTILKYSFTNAKSAEINRIYQQQKHY